MTRPQRNDQYVYTVEELKALLRERDDFLVSKGLFGEFVDSLTPKPVPRCEPPEWAKGEKFHWIDDKGTLCPVMWWGNIWTGPASDEFTPEQAAHLGWSWLSVARPTSPHLEPSDEAVRAWLYERGEFSPPTMGEIVRAALIHFSRPTVEISDGEIGMAWLELGEEFCNTPEKRAFTLSRFRKAARSLISKATGEAA